MIRSPKLEDAADLARVHIETWQEIYKNDFPVGFLDGLDHAARTKWFVRNIRNGAWLVVAEQGSQIAGFCMVSDADGEDGRGELLAIYVHPDFWGAGHGHALIRAGEDILARRGFTSAVLWVLQTNTRARQFYERQGWRRSKPIRIEEIGGVQVTELRYEKRLGSET